MSVLLLNLLSSSPTTALDCEFTGLVADASLEPELFDLPSDRYLKQKQSASKFSVCQLGLTTFIKDPTANRFEAKSFTFYVCPRSTSSHACRKLLLNTTSTEFLCDHGFNFQKWLQKGIPYLNRSEVQTLRERFENNDVVQEILDDRDDRNDQIFDLVDNINKFIADKKEDKQILLPFDNSVNHLRNYALLRRLRQVFPEVWIRSVNGHLLVKRLEEGDPDLEEVYRQEDDSAIEFARGFSRIIDIIIDSKKTIVGHNMSADLIFIYEHFIDVLPSNLKKFKAAIKETFPVVYDTKALFQELKTDFPEFKALVGKSSGVNDLFKSFGSTEFTANFLFNPTIELMSDENAVVEHVLKHHDAGSDSYACGVVFIRLAHASAMMQDRSPSKSPSWIHYVIALEPYVNQVNLIRAATHHLVSIFYSTLFTEVSVVYEKWFLQLVCVYVFDSCLVFGGSCQIRTGFLFICKSLLNLRSKKALRNKFCATCMSLCLMFFKLSVTCLF